jgi:hypothetical protein
MNSKAILIAYILRVFLNRMMTANEKTITLNDNNEILASDKSMKNLENNVTKTSRRMLFLSFLSKHI